MFRSTSFDSEESRRSEKNKKELKVLFVSRRDSCRGPIADSIFQHICDRHSMKPYSKFCWRSTSAGIRKYNQGNLPEQLAVRVLSENSLATVHGCRQIRAFDFTRYDYILCMEPSQLETLVDMAPEDKKARIHMLGEFIMGRVKAIEDPFGEDLNTFRICFERLYIACEDFYFHVNEKRLC